MHISQWQEYYGTNLIAMNTWYMASLPLDRWLPHKFFCFIMVALKALTDQCWVWWHYELLSVLADYPFASLLSPHLWPTPSCARVPDISDLLKNLSQTFYWVDALWRAWICKFCTHISYQRQTIMDWIIQYTILFLVHVRPLLETMLTIPKNGQQKWP